MLLLFKQRVEQTLWVTRGEEEAFQHVGRTEWMKKLQNLKASEVLTSSEDGGGGVKWGVG